MKFNKLFFIFSIFFILSISFVSAVPSGGVSRYNFTTLTDFWGSNDLTNVGASTSVVYPSFNISGNSAPNSFVFISAQSDYIYSSADLISSGSDFTISYWVYLDSFNAQNVPIGLREEVVTPSGDFIQANILPDGGLDYHMNDGGFDTPCSVSAGTISTSQWYNIVYTFDNTGNNKKVYVDTVEKCSQATTKSLAGLKMSVGALQSANYWIDGKIDEVQVFNRVLNTSEISRLFNYGNITIPSPPPSVINDSVESTAIVKQIGSVTINSAVFQTIFSSDFNISVNNTELYGAYSFNVLSTANNNLFCELLIDSVVVGNVSRSNVNGVLGSVFLMSPFFNLTNGTHNQELRCLKSGAAGFTISNAVGIGHLMIDEVGEVVPHDSIFGQGIVSSGASFTNIGELNFTISNRTLGNGLLKHLVIEWSSDYTNNAGGTELLSTFVQVNNINCSFFPRTVLSGNTGSVAGGCILENVTTNQTYNIKFFGNGSNALYNNGVLIVKEFILSPEEIQGGGGALTGTSFTGLVKLFNFTGGNLNHGLTNVFQLITLSVFSNESTTASFFVNIIDGNNFTTVNFTRDITTDIGVLIGHDVLEGIPEDNYTIELWGDCGNALCTIAGGDVNGYITDVTTTITNAFNLSVNDNFDNSSIGGSFTATLGGGTVFNSVNGWAIISSSNDFENITVSAVNNDYFDGLILNHNTSNDFSIGINQTLISWNCLEKVSGFNLNCSSPNSSVIFNYNVVGNPYIQSVNVSGYFERLISFSVNALQNTSFNAAGFYSSNLTLNSSSSVGLVSNCTYNISGITFPSFFESVSGSPLTTIGLINGSYNVVSDCVGFAVDDLNITINETIESLNFSLFTVNSILFNIFDLDSLNLLSSNVEIELLGSTATYNTNTSNGTVFIDGLNDDTYKITFISPLYNPTIIFGTISGGNHLDINAYMKNGTEIDFLVQDQSRVLLGNATLTFIQIINGSEITIGQAKTDFSGRASIFLDETIEYSLFVVKEGYITFTGQVTPTQSEYTIIMSAVGDDRFISIFEDLLLQFPFTYTPFSGFAIAKLILNSPAGALEYYGMNTTYRGTNYFINTSGVPAGGIETFNITSIDPDIEPIIIISYWFKYNGHALQEWNATYLVSDIVPVNMTLEGGLFDDLEALDNDNPIKGIMGAIIILALILMFSFSRDVTITSIGGLIGLGINWKFGLMPESILTVSIIVIFILIIADNIGGSR